VYGQAVIPVYGQAVIPVWVLLFSPHSSVGQAGLKDLSDPATFFRHQPCQEQITTSHRRTDAGIIMLS